MWQPLISGFDHAVARHSGAWTVEAVTTLMLELTPQVTRIRVLEQDLPWGRYLLHADPAGRYNVQLDVFSANYTGSIHAHGTWGSFWVLQGCLRAWDYTQQPDGFALLRAGVVPAGGAQCFCPPTSDWHRVGTPEQGPQTVSVHAYGPGFDLDQGIGLDEAGRPRTYARSPFQDLKQVASRLQLVGLEGHEGHP